MKRRKKKKRTREKERDTPWVTRAAASPTQEAVNVRGTEGRKVKSPKAKGR